MDDELEHSLRSWLDDFMQLFSWCHPSERASLFLNNYFLPGVYILAYLLGKKTLFIVSVSLLVKSLLSI